MRHVVVVRHLGERSCRCSAGRDVYWDELDPAPQPVETVAMDANDPLTIIYTSGTTGAPKGIVHSHVGFAVKAAVDFGYGFDVHDDDVIAWIADMGWMLGPLMIMGGLQLGATIVLTEGVPTIPTPDRLWDIAQRNEVTFQGIAPTAARAVMARTAMDDSGGLGSIRAFASTGEAWDEPTWRWLFERSGESAPSDHQLQRRHRDRWRHPRRLPVPAHGGRAASTVRCPGWTWPCSTRKGSRCVGEVGELDGPQHLAGHDARLLAATASAT